MLPLRKVGMDDWLRRLLVTLGIEIVPKLRRSLSQPDGEARLMRIGFLISALFALVHSVGIGLFVKSTAEELPMFERNYLVVASTAALFAVLYAALPFALQRWGLGRGLSAYVLLYCLLELVKAFHTIAFDWFVLHTGGVHVRDVTLTAIVVAATVAAMRRWLGDAQLLPGDPQLARIGSSFSIAVIILALVNGLLSQLLVRWGSFDEFAFSLFRVATAVGGGLLLARRAGSSGAKPFGANQWLALATYVLFIALATVMFADAQLAMPWAELIIATILLYTTWRERAEATPQLQAA